MTTLGVLGFSAGGHLAGCCCTMLDPPPDFGVLCYPVVAMTGEHHHAGSRHHLLGPDATDANAATLNLHDRVTPTTPPMFLWHTAADEPVPATNTLLLAAALAKHHIPFEAHVYERGRHGLGLVDATGPTATDQPPEVAAWKDACAAWLTRRAPHQEATP